MKIKVLYPEIRTSQPSYQTAASSLVVNLGILTTHTNTAEDFVYPIVRLIDASNGDVLGSETVQVRLNSFNTEYTVANLRPNTIHALIIDNFNNRLTTTIISTLSNYSNVTVVGRERIFSHESQFFGQDIERPVFEPGPVDFRKGLDLMNKTRGTAVIVENGQLFTFCPTHVITTRADYPNTIDYEPLPGMPLRTIVVNKLPQIYRKTNRIFGIEPPTRMRIINALAGVNIVTSGLVSEIDLENYGLSSNGTVLRAVFQTVPASL